jgi:hypoxanthine phosphoribosyltransferase
MTTTKNLIFTWEDFDKAVDSLTSCLKGHTSIKSVYGIPRGGLILAAALSHRLRVPLYMDSSKIDSSTVIADDISDSGHTLQTLVKSTKAYYCTVTIHYNPVSAYLPSFYYYLKEGGIWIEYPWESPITPKSNLHPKFSEEDLEKHIASRVAQAYRHGQESSYTKDFSVQLNTQEIITLLRNRKI